MSLLLDTLRDAEKDANSESVVACEAEREAESELVQEQILEMDLALDDVESTGEEADGVQRPPSAAAPLTAVTPAFAEARQRDTQSQSKSSLETEGSEKSDTGPTYTEATVKIRSCRKVPIGAALALFVVVGIAVLGIEYYSDPAVDSATAFASVDVGAPGAGDDLTSVGAAITPLPEAMASESGEATVAAPGALAVQDDRPPSAVAPVAAGATDSVVFPGETATVSELAVAPLQADLQWQRLETLVSETGSEADAETATQIMSETVKEVDGNRQVTGDEGVNRTVADEVASPAGIAPQLEPSAAGSIEIRKRRISVEEREALLRARQASAGGDWRVAAENYVQVIETHPKHVEARLGLAKAYSQLGAYQKATTQYLKTLEFSPNNVHATVGLIRLEPDQTQLSIKSRLRSLVTENPELAFLRAELGDYYIRLRDWRQVQQAYFDALRLAPDNPAYAYNLAIALDHLGKPELALSYYRRALAAMPAGLDTKQIQKRLSELEAG